ncbi:MAG: DUF4249 domain-containing protein [Tannerellaceae bacterium]|jgi:hypothetical protein|nr:DUF4249 domain-containing protein [Tannerellaceae bacterium]
MKNIIRIPLLIAFCSLASCIDRFEPEGIIAPQEGLLVVDGVITSGVTTIELSRTIPMETEWYDAPAVDNATLYVECNDGTRFTQTTNLGKGTYKILTGELHPGKQYRLHIHINGKTYESDYLAPLSSPAIDSISYQKQEPGDPIHITVSTHDEASNPSYFRWTYQENWEFKSELFAQYGKLYGYGPNIYFDLNSSNNIYYCWGTNQSRAFALGTTDKLSQNIISHKRLVKIPSDSEKISILYHIAVSQYRIREKAYHYFTNQQKNISQTGGIFSLIPGEIRGNIHSLTTPGEWVIGYVEVSIPSVKEQFMPELTLAYEPPPQTCARAVSNIPTGLIYMLGDPILYAPERCLDCTTRGTKNKPAFWPTSHL